MVIKEDSINAKPIENLTVSHQFFRLNKHYIQKNVVTNQFLHKLV